RVGVHEERAMGREAIAEIEREERAARGAMEAADAAIARADKARQRAARLLERWIIGASTTPANAREENDKAAWRPALAPIEAASSSAMARAARAKEAKRHSERELERTRARLAVANVVEPRYFGRIEVDLEGEEEADVIVRVTYRVACAVWRPEHLA